MKSINKSHVTQIIDLVCLDEDKKINLQLFIGLAALSERAFYDQFVYFLNFVHIFFLTLFFRTEDTIDLPEYQKDKIECADFGSLASKLDGIKINSQMLNLLKSL